MGQSIGELFVKLGFEVDDAPLKSFDNSIKDVFNTVKSIAGVSLTGAGLYELAKGAEQTALQIENMTAVFGVSAKAIQAWGAAVHENNPLKSYKEGIASFGNVAQYLSNAANSASGTVALNRLGVPFSVTNDTQHPERILDKLFDTVPQLLAAHPEKRGLYSQLVGEITGDAANIQIFERGRAFADKAAQNVSVYQKDLDDTTKVSRDIAGLQDQWDHFVNHAIGTLASGLLEMEKNIKDHGVLAGLGITVDELGAADPYNLKGAHNALVNNPVMVGLSTAAAQAIEGAPESAVSNRKDSLSFWEAHGFTPPQIAAWIAQEQAESAFNPRAKNGQFQGSFQWSPARAKEILGGTGIDISKANHWQQLQAAEWEFRKMGLEDQYRKLADPRDASKFLSDKFEIHEKFNKSHGDETAYRESLAEKQIPQLNLTVTQVIHSNADADEVARIANDRLGQSVLSAYLNMPGANP